MRAILIAVAGLVLVGACAGPAPRQSPVVAGPWVGVSVAPAALTEVAVAARDGRIWVAGGLRGDGSASDEVLVFDPANGAWTAGPRLPGGVHHAALISTPDGLLLVGGYAGDAPTAAVRVLEDEAATWVDAGVLPDPRAAGAAAFDGSRVVYAGGVGPAGVAADVFAQGVEGWERIGRLPVAREHLAATSDGAGRTFVLGGRVGGLDRNLGTVDLVAGDGVTTLGSLPTARGGVGAFWWPPLGACLAGGESPGGTNPQVECIDAAGVVRVLPDLGVARHGVGAAVVGGTAYVVLGGRQPGLFASDVTEALRLP
jgi:non-specific serine/threonine protein kinase